MYVCMWWRKKKLAVLVVPMASLRTSELSSSSYAVFYFTLTFNALYNKIIFILI